MSAEKPDVDFEKWAKTDPKRLNWKDIPFFFQSTFPQYRKIVGGEEMKLDGTETDETVIVEYAESEQYKKWREEVLKRGPQS